jgi:hypothetical protein
MTGGGARRRIGELRRGMRRHDELHDRVEGLASGPSA